MTERHAHKICVLLFFDFYFALFLHYFLRLNVYAVLRCVFVITLCWSACLLFDC
jgi:hypothetical protein